MASPGGSLEFIRSVTLQSIISYNALRMSSRCKYKLCIHFLTLACGRIANSAKHSALTLTVTFRFLLSVWPEVDFFFSARRVKAIDVCSDGIEV